MSKLFTKILCPSDFDPGSRKAIELACEMAHSDSTIYLLHVVSIAPVVSGVPLEPYSVTGGEVRRELERMVPSQAQGKVRFEIVARAGDAATEILRAITELGVDSVVMATHGRTGVGRFLLGSVAQKVVRDSPCPVLTVRNAD